MDIKTMENNNIPQTQLNELSNLQELTKALVTYIEKEGFDGSQGQNLKFLHSDLNHLLSEMQRCGVTIETNECAKTDIAKEVGFWMCILGQELQKK